MPNLITAFIQGERYQIEFPDDTPEETMTSAMQTLFRSSTPDPEAAPTSADLFDQAAEFTFSWEGGFADDPRDPGRQTKYGISAKTFPNVDVPNLTREDAKALYRKEFWERPRFDRLPDDRLAVKVFDTGVNMGTGAAAKLLQRAINDVRGEGVEPIEEDGVVGSKTLAAVMELDADELLEAFVLRQRKRYADIIRAQPSLSAFVRGWARRARAVPEAP